MPRDQTHDALGCPVLARELRAPTRMIEIARECRVSGRETVAHVRSEIEEHACHAVPQERVRGLRGVVEDARHDELFIRAEMPKDPRGLCRVAIVRAGRADVSHRLPYAVAHGQNLEPVKRPNRNVAGPKTTRRKTCAPKNRRASRRIGPYCW